MTNEERVLRYLSRIAPNAATNAEISKFAEVSPHQQVFQITQRLVGQGRLKAGRDGRGWRFWIEKAAKTAVEAAPPPTPTVAHEDQIGISAAARSFEELAREVMAAHYGTRLTSRQVPSVPKTFDFVSSDGTIVGDAKFFSLVRGEMMPPAKFSIIAEHVWLLERAGCAHPFLVFGNDRRVPDRWLEKYGQLRQGVEFFFIDGDGKLLALG